jgi:hypothetical protein
MMLKKYRFATSSVWTPQEDIILMRIFIKFGKYWNPIYNKFRRKLPSEVRERIFSVILPKILRNETDEVPKFLEEYIKIYYKNNEKWK